MPSENSIRGLPQIYPRGPDEYRRLRSIRWPSNEHGRFSKHKTTFACSLFAYSTTQNNLYKSSEWAKTRQQPVARQLLLLLSQMLQFTGIISRPLSSSWYVDDSILQLDRNLIACGWRRFCSSHRSRGRRRDSDFLARRCQHHVCCSSCSSHLAGCRFLGTQMVYRRDWGFRFRGLHPNFPCHNLQYGYCRILFGWGVWWNITTHARCHL
jgi:hypothetical protein